MLKFHEIRNDDDEILLVGPKQNNGEFDWFPVIRLEYTDKWSDDPMEPYHCVLLVVSPQQAKETNAWERACECCGVAEEERATMGEVWQCEVLIGYGSYAPTWQRFGKNKRHLLAEARRQAKLLCSFAFGFAMDKAVNRMGTSGWEVIRGEL